MCIMHDKMTAKFIVNCSHSTHSEWRVRFWFWLMLLSDPNESMTIFVWNVINLTTFQHFPYVILANNEHIWNWAPYPNQLAKPTSEAHCYEMKCFNRNMAHFLKVCYEFHMWFSGFRIFVFSSPYIYMCVCVFWESAPMLLGFRLFECKLVVPQEQWAPSTMQYIKYSVVV